MSTGAERRVYVPADRTDLEELAGARREGRDPVVVAVGQVVHAVTGALRAAAPDAGEEELEHLAMTTAAQASVERTGQGHTGPPLRTVLALDASVYEGGPDEDDATAVRVSDERTARHLASVLVDSPDAAEAVRSARGGGSAEPCLDHELGWWSPEELDSLLQQSGRV